MFAKTLFRGAVVIAYKDSFQIKFKIRENPHFPSFVETMRESGETNAHAVAIMYATVVIEEMEKPLRFTDKVIYRKIASGTPVALAHVEDRRDELANLVWEQIQENLTDKEFLRELFSRIYG